MAKESGELYKKHKGGDYLSKSLKKKQNNEDVVNAGIAGASAEAVQIFGSAVKEHVVAYTGNDNETGLKLKKSLQSISKEKVNPDYEYQNLKQQAGFSAEVKDTANTNAESIINTSQIRKIRTDDVGSVNDPLYDHVLIDEADNIIAGSGSQMKFVGGSPQEAFKKLTSKEFSKYLENDVKIEVPSDYYEGILTEANSKLKKLQEQLVNQRAKGNEDVVRRLEKQIENCEVIKKNLCESTLSTKEAMFARKHPVLSTAKDITKISHRAGVETAQTAALIGGGASIVKNLVAVAKGDEEIEDAIGNVVKDTAASAAVGYGTGFTGSFIKGAMQNASSKPIQALAKTNLPGVVVAVAVGATKTMRKYFAGEITGLECFEELGEQGVGMLSSSLFTVIGQAVIPIPVVGAIIGSMLGYAIASASYGTLLTSLKEAQFAHDERVRIEKECEEHIQLIRTYRLELEQSISKYLVSSIEEFHRSFDNIKASLDIGDVDGFITGVNEISQALGKEPQFKCMNEFESIMNSKIKFIL